MASTTPVSAERESMAEVLRRVSQSEDTNIRVCFAADLNAFLLSMRFLSGRAQVEAEDVALLFRRFELTLAADRRSDPGPSKFRPQPKAEDGRVDMHALAAEIGGQN